MAAAVSSSSSSYRQKRKQAAIYISSDSDHEEEDEDESEGSEAEFDEDDGDGSEGGESEEDDDEEEEPLSEGSAGSEADYEEDSEDGDEDDDDDDVADSERDGDSPEAKPSEEKLYSKVVDHLQRRRSLNTLKLEECKSYLRRHQLRLSGTKATCIERILEHWRIKDGNGEHLYPRSSFAINCTGDVCKGDVILFKQRVYQKFDIVKRGGGGNIIGKRIIAGRVVKESYGAAKQQHTFTVEILWSKGVKPLPPLSPLLVKGRNLYRLKTFRRPWSNEAERNKVLAEKHRRGAAARHVREIAKSSASRGFKRHKSSTVKAPSNKRGKIEPMPAIRKKMQNMPATRMKKQNSQPAKSTSNGHVRTRQVTKVKHGESSSSTKQKHVQRNKSLPTDQAMPRQVAKARHEDSSFTNQKYARGENGIHSHPQFPYDQMGSYQNRLANPQADRRLSQLPSYAAGYAYAGKGVPHPHFLDRGGGYTNHPYLNPSQFDPRSSNHVFRQMHFDYGAGAPPGDQFHRQRWP